MAELSGQESSEWGESPEVVKPKEVEAVVSDVLNTQHDHLMAEIESSDGTHWSSLRSVFSSGEHPIFMQKLDNRIRYHDKEIERMCNYHYQGFIDSIRELLQVREEAVKLKDDVQYSNGTLQESGKKLVFKVEELVQCRKTQQNITSTIENLELCLPVLEMYHKLRDQMQSKRYYPALKTLEQLEHTYLPRVSNYRFSQVMSETIPQLREQIKDASMSDLKDFLENIRKHSSTLGEVAMKHCAEQNKMDITLAKRRAKKQKRKAPPPPNPFTGEVEQSSASSNPFEDAEELQVPETLDEDLSAQDLVDFSPVYRCLHIYTVLGAREQFESYYRKQRRKQARLALNPPANMHESLDGYKSYFHDIIGFFVVEDHILNTTTGLVNRSYIDELWEMALLKIVAVLRTHSAYCTDASLMLQIKNTIVLFCLTLKGYNFNVSQLYDLLVEIRDLYNEIIMKKWLQIFRDIFEEDNYTAIFVQNDAEYLAIVQKYPYKDSKLASADYPKCFPFSSFVPKVYSQVKEFIYACLKFAEDLHLSHTEIDDMVRKSANMLLTKTLSYTLTNQIKTAKLTLLQLIQISINMNYLEQSCDYLEDFISNITGAEKDSVHAAKLQGTSMFKDARSDAEEQIYKQLNLKIDEFMELSSYDWLLDESFGHASEYVTDLIAFLQSIFMSFTNLPPKVAQTACMSACKHIGTTLKDMLLNNDLKHVTQGALEQLNLDLIQCEAFAESDPVPGLKDGTLQLAFIDLRQLLNLFMDWDWSTYLADYSKPTSKYLRVSPSTAISLLEKLRDGDKRKGNIFASFKKNERDKKKLIDTVLKQLRGLTSTITVT